MRPPPALAAGRLAAVGDFRGAALREAFVAQRFVLSTVLHVAVLPARHAESPLCLHRPLAGFFGSQLSRRLDVNMTVTASLDSSRTAKTRGTSNPVLKKARDRAESSRHSTFAVSSLPMMRIEQTARFLSRALCRRPCNRSRESWEGTCELSPNLTGATQAATFVHGSRPSPARPLRDEGRTPEAEGLTAAKDPARISSSARPGTITDDVRASHRLTGSHRGE